MANFAKWAAGVFQSGAWGTSTQSGFSSSDITAFNSLATGSCVIASTAISNSANLDLLGEISISLVINASTAATTASYVAVYLLPLNQDGTTYGDNIATGGASAVLPGQSYWKKNISIRSNLAAAGTAVGTSEPFALPRGDFKLAIAQQIGAALNAAAAAVISLRTTIENLNG